MSCDSTRAWSETWVACKSCDSSRAGFMDSRWPGLPDTLIAGTDPALDPFLLLFEPPNNRCILELFGVVGLAEVGVCGSELRYRSVRPGLFGVDLSDSAENCFAPSCLLMYSLSAWCRPLAGCSPKGSISTPALHFVRARIGLASAWQSTLLTQRNGACHTATMK
jgi:hypothetical protein